MTSELPPLRLHNTLTRRKEEFRPIDPRNVRMYVCGPTVYDFAHIGNARPVIVFDLLFRLLRHRYGAEHVTYVRNITDVDDKINARARAEHPDLPLNEAIRRVTTDTERQFHADIRALGVLMPEDVNVPGQRPVLIEPRATEHIDEMRRLIDRLVASGHAYLAEGHALFHVPSMPDYGGLSRRPLDEMEAGARVDVAPYKRSPLDFVLWKPSAPDEPGWPGPDGLEGLGRPGWHIECSAMSWRHLGEIFDIHGGGLDLIFPHHENEIAQSRCCFGTPTMANYWLHNGFLQVEGEKMSKSLGNFVTIRDVLRGWKGRPWSGASLRLAMLGTHYRQPLDWTEARLTHARAELATWARECDEELLADQADQLWSEPPTPSREVIEALSDDLNTPEMLAVLRRNFDRVQRGRGRSEFLANMRFLGLFQSRNTRPLQAPTVFLSGWGGIPKNVVDRVGPALWNLGTYAANNDAEMIKSCEAEISRMGIKVVEKAGQASVEYRGTSNAGSVDELIAERNAARAAKNWAESDRIRDELKAMGVQLKDNKDGTTTWEVVRS